MELTQPVGTKEKEPVHVDDWIDLHFCKDQYPRFFCFLHRLSAALQNDWRQWISKYKLFCTYRGIRYRVTGASRMGDIWLAEDFDRETGYDLRVSHEDCSDWAPTADGSEEIHGVLISSESKKTAKIRHQMEGYRAELRGLEPQVNALKAIQMSLSQKGDIAKEVLELVDEVVKELDRASRVQIKGD